MHDSRAKIKNGMQRPLLWRFLPYRLMLPNMNEELAAALIKRCSRHLLPGSIGLSYYRVWVASEEEVAPGVSKALRSIAKTELGTADELLVRSAIQALGCVGAEDDIKNLQSLLISASDQIYVDVEAAIALIYHRGKSIEVLLNEVIDQASFVVFATALVQ
ncbi:MAG: hypothetical protein M0Q15_19235 [Nevskia sp.]|jgi:hypothetical protein|nr:hypothetical protein [Nevskia sp.]